MRVVGRLVRTEVLGNRDILEGSVLVTHPVSLDELVGGIIRRGEDLLGVLVQVAPGTFTYAVRFHDISSLNGGSSGTVTLSVVVLDNDGQMVEDEFQLELCGSEMVHCSGRCVDPQGPDAC